MKTNTTKHEKLQVSELFLRAVALYKSGQYQSSVDYFRHVTLLAPLEGRFWVSLGHATRKSGDIEGAMEAYKAALLLDQDKDSDLWLSLAECFQDKGMTEQAQAALQEATLLAAPEMKERLALINQAWSNKDYHASIT